MAKHDVVVIGSSAGGVEGLSTIAAHLPKYLGAAVFMMIHRNSHDEANVLASILRRNARLHVVPAVDGMTFTKGHIYVAHPGRHLLVRRGHLRVSNGPLHNRWRPSADVLFRSAALSYGPRVIGVVLSGSLDDGAAGLSAIESRGGLSVVEDPATAEFSDMPRNALRVVRKAQVAPVEQIASLLAELVEKPSPPEDEFAIPQGMEDEVRTSEGGKMGMDALHAWGRRTDIVCPECSGWMVERQEGKLLRYRCHTGHAFSPESLFEQQAEQVERELYIALRGMEELAALTRRLLECARDENSAEQIAMYENRVRDAETATTDLRRLLAQRNPTGPKQAD